MEPTTTTTAPPATPATTIKGHFDGTAVVLDEPATLAVGQIVRVVVVDLAPPVAPPAPPASRFGFAKGMFEMSEDFNDTPEEFAEYM